MTLPNHFVTVIDRRARALETYENGRLIYVHVDGVWWAARGTATVSSEPGSERGVCFFRSPVSGETADEYTAHALPAGVVYRFPSAFRIDWTNDVSANRVLITPGTDRTFQLISVSGATTQSTLFTYPNGVKPIVAPQNLCLQPRADRRPGKPESFIPPSSTSGQ